MTEPSAAPRERAPMPGSPPTGPTPGLPPTGLRLPEPPAYRAHPLAPAGACINCGTTIGAARSAPRCWECGRALCVECYWRHGLTPADHRCAGCTARGPPPSTAISGGHVSLR